MKAVQDFDNQIPLDRKVFVFAKNKEMWTRGRLTSEVDRVASGLTGLGIHQIDRVGCISALKPKSANCLSPNQSPEA